MTSLYGLRRTSVPARHSLPHVLPTGSELLSVARVGDVSVRTRRARVCHRSRPQPLAVYCNCVVSTSCPVLLYAPSVPAVTPSGSCASHVVQFCQTTFEDGIRLHVADLLHGDPPLPGDGPAGYGQNTERNRRRHGGQDLLQDEVCDDCRM